MRTWEPPVPERRRPNRVPADQGHPLLHLQRAAGNRAVALGVQRLEEAPTSGDPATDDARRTGRHSTEVNLSVVYVADRSTDGSYTAPKALTVHASRGDGGAHPDQHAERLALAAAEGDGYEWSPQGEIRSTSVGKIVRVHTELYPCEPCVRWLDGNLPRIPVTWTAPYAKRGDYSWSWRVPNLLFKFRLSVSPRLKVLSDWADGLGDATRIQRVDQVWRQLVDMDYNPIKWSEWFRGAGSDHAARERAASTYALTVQEVWRGNIEALEEEKRHRSPPPARPAAFTATPQPPRPTNATRILGPSPSPSGGTSGVVLPARKPWRGR